MRIWLESETECTVDGVGLLEPGVPVEVDLAMFQLFHKVTPAEANFPRHVKVTYEVEPTVATEEKEEGE